MSISCRYVRGLAFLVALAIADVTCGSTFAVDDWAVVFGAQGRHLANAGDDDRLTSRDMLFDGPSSSPLQGAGVISNNAASGETAIGLSPDTRLVCIRFQRAHLRPFVAGCCIPQCMPCPPELFYPCPSDPPADPPLAEQLPLPEDLASPSGGYGASGYGGPISLLASAADYSTNWFASSASRGGPSGAFFGDAGYGGGGVGGGGGGFFSSADPGGPGGPGSGGPGGPGSGGPGTGGPGSGGPGGPGGGPGGGGEGEGEGPDNATAPEPASIIAWVLAGATVLLRRAVRRSPRF